MQIGVASKCAYCQGPFVTRSAMHIYCDPCSEDRDLKRKRLWAKDHPASLEKVRAWHAARRSKSVVIGEKISVENAQSISWTTKPDLMWIVRFWVPFSYAASKNHAYTLTRHGGLHLRNEMQAMQESIGWAAKAALREQKVVHAKVWLDILVQKPNHRGDAVNVVDAVCDGLKHAIGIDDRWFSIRSLDWEIKKIEPRLYIGIGQDTDQDMRVCSHCGQIKTLDHFNKHKGGPLGVARACRECRIIGRRKQA